MEGQTVREVFSDVQTGDIILSSAKCLGSLVVRAVLGTGWSHVGIAIRVDRDGNLISYTAPESVLYILDSRPGKREDAKTGCTLSGVALTPLNTFLEGTERIGYRPLLPHLRTQEMLRLTRTFMDEVHGASYPSYGTLISMWAGVSTAGHEGYFCSELAAIYCDRCIGPIAKDGYIAGDLRALFGPTALECHSMYSPREFGLPSSGASTIFETKEIIVHHKHTYTMAIAGIVLMLVLIIVTCAIACLCRTSHIKSGVMSSLILLTILIGVLCIRGIIHIRRETYRSNG